MVRWNIDKSIPDNDFTLLSAYRLQFFADEGGDKTEEPTAKKLSKAREEGQVAKSKELITAVSLMGLFLILKVYAGSLGTGLIESFNKFYTMISVIAKEDEEFNLNVITTLVREALTDFVLICIPVFLVVFIIAILINIVQVKWKVSTKPMQPKLSKFNPINGLKNMFKPEKIVDLLKEFIKIGIIGYLAINTVMDQMELLFLLPDIDMNNGIMLVGEIIVDMGIKLSAFYLVLGFADYMYQKFKFKKDMKMTKQEVKDEFKNTEGDPQIKGRIRSKMREASQRRMMQQLPEADVVITNPTHFACAIKYDKEKAEAPILIAKGADYLAQKIKDAAKEHDVPIVENKALARMLYYNVEIDAEIPRELYQMTAEVLAYVYSLKNKKTA